MRYVTIVFVRKGLLLREWTDEVLRGTKIRRRWGCHLRGIHKRGIPLAATLKKEYVRDNKNGTEK